MSTGNIRLSWNDVNEIEKGHKIYRSTSPMDTNNLPNAIAVLGSNTTEYIDENLTVGDIYYYRVSAFIDNDEQVSSEVQVQVKPGYSIFTVSEDGDSIKLTSDGIEEFTTTFHTAAINDVSIDTDDNYFTVGDDNLLIMTNSDGIKQWEFNHENPVLSVCVDNLGFVYTGDSTGLLRKFDYLGDIVWTIMAHETGIEKVHCDYGNVLYTAATDNVLKRFDGNGTLTDFIVFSDVVNSITTNIYNADIYVSIGNSIYILDYQFNQTLSFTPHTNTITELVFDKDGFIISGSLDNSIMRHDLSGVTVQTYNNDSPITSVACDDYGSIYFSDNSFDLKKINRNNELVWEFIENTNTINRVNITKNIEIVPNLNFKISWEELLAPDQRSGINETQISLVLNPPIAYEITEPYLKQLSRPVNVVAVYDDTI